MIMYFNNSPDDDLPNTPEITPQNSTNGAPTNAVVINILRVLIGWLILANIIIIACFVLNRHKHWPLFTVQILCSSIGDLFTGIVIVPIGIGLLTEPQYRIRCAFMMYALITSQCISMLNLFSICVYRFRTIQKVKHHAESGMVRRVPVYMAIVSWIASFIMCAIPFVIWSKQANEQIPFCLLGYPFANVKGAMTYFACVLFIPNALTNVLYIVAYLRLRYIIGLRVFPTLPPRSAATHVASVTQTTSMGIESHTNKGNQLPTHSINKSSRKVPSRAIENGHHFERTNTRIQQEVLRTIGILLILFNICTVPLICSLFLSDTETHRNVRFLICMLFLFHSVLNPIIYGLRSSWLSLALRKMFSDFKRTILCST